MLTTTVKVSSPSVSSVKLAVTPQYRYSWRRRSLVSFKMMRVACFSSHANALFTEGRSEIRYSYVDKMLPSSTRFYAGDAYASIRAHKPVTPAALPIYDSCDGVLTPNHLTVTANENPIVNREKLVSAVSRLCQVVKPPKRPAVVSSCSLDGHEVRVMHKLGVVQGIEGQRHDDLVAIYHLQPSKRDVLMTYRPTPTPIGAAMPVLERPESASGVGQSGECRGRRATRPITAPTQPLVRRLVFVPSPRFALRAAPGTLAHPPASAGNTVGSAPHAPAAKAASSASRAVTFAVSEEVDAAGQSIPSAAVTAGPVTVMATPAQREKRRRRQLRTRMRRLLRQAIKLALEDAALGRTIGSKSSNAPLVDLAKLTRVAMETRRIIDALKRSDLFAQVDAQHLRLIASSGARRTYQRYDVLYREGAPAQCFYMLTRGTLMESSTHTAGAAYGVDEPKLLSARENFSIRGVGQGGGGEADEQGGSGKAGGASDATGTSCYVLFGLETLVGRERESTLLAMSDVDVIRFNSSNTILGGDTFARSLKLDAKAAAKVAKRIFHAFVYGELSPMQLFHGVKENILRALLPLFTLEEIEEGALIFGLGYAPDKVYVLMHGSVHLRRRDGTRLAALSAEQGQSGRGLEPRELPTFGEMAMLDRKARTTSAIAVTACKLLVLHAEHFGACTELVPDIKERLRSQLEHAD